LGIFKLGKQHGGNAFKLDLPEYKKLGKTFDISNMRLSTVDLTRDQSLLSSMRIVTIRAALEAA
jgi:hypothetical protein